MNESKLNQETSTVPALEKFLKEAKPQGINKSYYKGKWHENGNYSPKEHKVYS